MKLVGRVMAIAVLGFLGFGCGGGDDSDNGRSGNGGGAGSSGMGGSGMGSSGMSGGDPNEVDAAGICPRFAEILCAAEASCCTAPGRDQAACKAELEDDCTSTFDAAVIAADPLVGFDANRAKAALTELESRTEDCDTDVSAWSITTDGLRSMFAGTLDSGAACDPEGGAANADFTDIAIALASCKNAATTACLPAESGWTCAARSAASGPCLSDLNCQDGLYCQLGEGLYDGTCAARKATGMECAADSECVSFVCKDDACAPENDAQATYCPR